MNQPAHDRFTHTHGQYLDVNGARLYVEQIGHPDGPALVLLHGGFGNIETFNAITPALAPHYRLIGIDSRAQGMSTMGNDNDALSYARLQQDVEAVVRQLGLAAHHVIGFSDGGIIGLRLAAAQGAGAGPLRGVISIGGHWQLAADDPTRAVFADISTAFWRTHFPEEYERYQALNPAPDFDALVERIRALWLDDGDSGYPGESVRDIRVPLLVVHGEDDPVVVRSNPLTLVERVSGARLLWLPLTGHAAHEERPEWLAPALKAFLKYSEALVATERRSDQSG